MKLKIVLIGLGIVLVGIPGYTTLPDFIAKGMNAFSFGGASSSPMSNQIFSQLGMPSIPDAHTVSTFSQYLFIGVIVVGLGMMAFGTISKKITKRTPVKMPFEAPQVQDNQNDAGAIAIKLLQEKLAKGEISSSQYQNLKKMAEEDRL